MVYDLNEKRIKHKQERKRRQATWNKTIRWQIRTERVNNITKKKKGKKN